jgi:CheY-like chemotaxis protein
LLPTVFDLFTQAERSLDRSQGGLGVGLTIVKRIIDMHGGSVKVFSEGLGHGSEFVVRLPLAKKPAEPSAPKERSERAETQLRTLVVDDNQDAANSLALLLRQSGDQVRVAYSGAMALELAPEFKPHAILLDIGMPELDGYEVARRIRKDKQFANVRLIALTGYGRDADRKQTQEAGFDAHLIKPVEPQQLRELLTRLTGPALPAGPRLDHAAGEI